ncbi:hypothetical protein [Phenylobacterium sp.]|jgi:hypothetical protein|uniref:hypothetical protein n=1 Tax=Phenylobacterium sp. TaxID=1871053 RepID=UPI003783CCFC
MISISTRESITAVLTNHQLDAELRALIGLRAWQLDVERERPLDDTIRFVIVQPGDKPEVINAVVGFPITYDQAEQPGFEWMEDHGAWFELAYVLTDDFGMIVFVADHPDTNSVLRFNCLMVADRQMPLENKTET